MQSRANISPGQRVPVSLSRRIAYFILDHRPFIIIVSLIITFFLSFQLRLFRITQNIRDDLPRDDPEILYFKRFGQLFGNAELMVVAIQADDVFTHETLSYIRQMTEAIESVPGVREVVSLANAVEIRNDGDMLVSTPFMEEIPTSPAALEAKRREALAHRHWVRSIISPDATCASINVLLRSIADDTIERFKTVAEIERIAKENVPSRVTVYVTGLTPMLTDAMRLVHQDFRHFLWLTPVLSLLVLFVAFRTLRGVIVPTTIVCISLIWTLGIFFTAGNAVNMITTMLPTLIAVICLSDVIHILARYYELASPDTNRREVIAAPMEHMIPACFLTSVTTAVGFASLGISQLKSISNFGFYSAIGIMIAYVLAITIVPLVLSFLQLPRAEVQTGYERSVWVRLIAGFVRFLERDRFVVPAATLVVVGAAILGMTRMKVETHIAAYLPNHAPSIRGLHFLEKEMAGFSQIEVTLEGAPGVFKEPWAIAEMEKVQRFMESCPAVDRAFSLADFIKEIHRLRSGGDGPQLVVPTDPALVAEYLFLFSMTDRSDLLHSFASPDYSVCRISARVRSMSTVDQLALLATLERFAEQGVDKRLTFRTTGILKLYATNVTAVVRSMIQSLGISLVVIAALMVIHLRSFRVGLLSMIPNVIPVVMTFGMMGFFGISLNASTIMIFCIALAIAVDDTIHFLARYRREGASGQSIPASIARTMLHTGRAMIVTSLVIVVGFSILTYSSFAPNGHFGILAAITMIAALIGDLALLPYLIKLFKVR